MSNNLFAFSCNGKMEPGSPSVSSPLFVRTPIAQQEQRQRPNLTRLQASMDASAAMPLNRMLLHESPAATISAPSVMPPPPPIRATSSSSWFSTADDIRFEARLPAMRLSLPSPTCPQTPNPPLQQRKTRGPFATASNRNASKYSRVARKSVETDSPRPADVICVHLPKQDLKKHSGNVYYQSLVDDFGSRLVDRSELDKNHSDEQNNSEEEWPSLNKRKEYAERIVQMVRESDGRFLFKTKNDPNFYEIGDYSAIRKTNKLLQKALILSNGAPPVGVKSPEPDEFVRQLNQDLMDTDTKNSDRQLLEEVFQLLTIPSRDGLDSKTITPEEEATTTTLVEEIKPPPLFPEDLPDLVPPQPQRCNSYPPAIPASTLTNRPTPPLSLEATDIRLPSQFLHYHHGDPIH